MAIIIIAFVTFKYHLLIFMISLSIWVPCYAPLVMTNSLINKKTELINGNFSSI